MECASVRCGAADVHGACDEMSVWVCPVNVGKKFIAHAIRVTSIKLDFEMEQEGIHSGLGD